MATLRARWEVVGEHKFLVGEAEFAVKDTGDLWRIWPARSCPRLPLPGMARQG